MAPDKGFQLCRQVILCDATAFGQSFSCTCSLNRALHREVSYETVVISWAQVCKSKTSATKLMPKTKGLLTAENIVYN